MAHIWKVTIGYYPVVDDFEIYYVITKDFNVNKAWGEARVPHKFYSAKIEWVGKSREKGEESSETPS